MKELIENADCWLKSFAAIGTPEFVRDWAQGVDLVAALKAALEAAEARTVRLECHKRMLDEGVSQLTAENAELRARVASPIVRLGSGKVEVAEGAYEGVRALMFTVNGTGIVGEDIPYDGPRTVPEDDLLAVVTFSNIESLSVVIDKLLLIQRTFVKIPAAPKEERQCISG